MIMNTSRILIGKNETRNFLSYKPSTTCALRLSRVHSLSRLCSVGHSNSSCWRDYNNIHDHKNQLMMQNRSIIQKRQMSLLGKSVMSPFIKSSYLFWGIPLSALLDSYIVTLPFDLFFGTLLPYHAYIGMNHIATDYFPNFKFLSYIISIIIFIGLQNNNINGDGISSNINRLFNSNKQGYKDTSQSTPWISLNSNKKQDAYVNYDDLEWQSSPAKGVFRKMLERLGGEVARCTTIVKYDANSKFPSHIHSGGEEFLILNGKWNDEFGEFNKYRYIRNYIGSKHSPNIGNDGCIIFVKLRQMSQNLKEENHFDCDATINNDDGDISKSQCKLLFKSDNEMVFVEKHKPNEKFIINIPKYGKELFVIEGSFDIINDSSNNNKIQFVNKNICKWSWMRLVGNNKNNNKNEERKIEAISGNEGCFIYVKQDHLNSDQVGAAKPQNNKEWFEYFIDYLRNKN